MESLNDSRHFDPPSDVLWCEQHDYPRPCPECKAEYQEWQGEMKREHA